MSSQTKNLKSRTTNKKIKHLGVLFFSLFLTLAVFSQVAAKPTSDVGFGRADWLYYKSNNDITAYLGKKSSNLPTVRYQKNKDYLEFSMTRAGYSNPSSSAGELQPNTYNLQPISSTTSVSLETDVKTPNTPTLFYRNILKNVDANYQITNIPFKIKEEIILKKVLGVSDLGFREENGKLQPNTYNLKPSPQNLKPITFLFSAETSAKPVKQQDGSIAFFGDNGEYLFQLDKPFMIDASGNRSEAVSIEIVPTNKKSIVSNGFFDAFTGASAGIVNRADSLADRNILSSSLANIKKVLEARGIEPPRRGLTIPTLRQAAPRTGLVYHKPKPNPHNLTPKNYTLILSADSNWLSTAAYPVIIDPTITHNADAEFDGQKNRIADNDSTSSTQLESSYPEATKDPHTVLLLHFNETNGTTAGIRDYASTTRVITANGNASTTGYVTQLGLGNSAAFDGTGDYLSMPDSDDWNFGSGDFSIDFWVRFNSTPGQILFLDQINGTDYQYLLWNTTRLEFGSFLADVGKAQYYFTWSPSLNTWYHIAVARNGSNFDMFLNGISRSLTVGAAVGNNTLVNVANPFTIGDRSTGSFGLNGWMDSLRIIKGRALTPEEIKAAASRRPYAVYTSSVLDASASTQWDTLNWTEGGVNTGNGEQPYNTGSLVAQWDFNDTSGTTLTASSSGSCTTSCNGTLTNFAYTSSQDQATTTTGWTANNKKWGAGSLMFDGTNDYVSVGDNDGWTFGSGDFTIEAWINPTTVGDTEPIYTQRPSPYNVGSVQLYLGGPPPGDWFYAIFSNTSDVVVGSYRSTAKIAAGKWIHLVFVRNGTSGKIYVNGVEGTTVTTELGATVLENLADSVHIGRNNASYFGGVIDSIRVYKSRALSASEILSNYQAGNIEIQTRSGATSDPNDGSWGEWKPTTGETQLLSMDSDAGNWNAPQQIDGYTKLLLHMDGTDAATTFPNSATTTHTVTAVGNAQVDTAQSKFGGGSGLFDGTGDYLSVPDSDDWNFGSGDFTIDFWIRLNNLAGTDDHLYSQSNGDTDTLQFWINVTSGVGFNVQSGGLSLVSFNQGNSSGWSNNNWYHVALVRNGNNWNIYRNGVSVVSTTDTDSVPDVARPLYIGRRNDTQVEEFDGSLDELRISKGIARWTSNFTPPPRAYGSNVKADNETTLKMEGTGSAKLTLGAPQIDGNTVALWHFEETGTTTGTYLYDETANNNDTTTTGNVAPAEGIFGKARYFDGVSDYLSAPDSANWDFGTGAFGVDAWVKFNSIPTSVIVGQYNPAITANWFFTYQIAGSSLCLRIYTGAWNDTCVSWTPTTNKWYHVAATRSGSTITLYVDGLSIGSGSNSADATDENGMTLTMGGLNDNTSELDGNLDEVRIIKGRALSPDEIAETYRMGANHHLTRQVSATDLSSANKLAFNVAGDRPGAYLETMLGESDYANYELASSTLALSTTTVLYIKGDEIASSTSIKDSSFSGKAITANGNARTSGNGKIGNSVYFDGNSSDFLELGDSDDWYFSGSFSLDTWVMFTGTNPGNVSFIFDQVNGTDTNRFMYRWSESLFQYTTMTSGVTQVTVDGPVNISLNIWYHVAFVRDAASGLYSIYVNGQKIGEVSDVDDPPNVSATPRIGLGDNGVSDWLKGYLDELRILKGTALTPDQIRQAYEYGLRSHQITIDFGATLQTSDLISNSTDYNFNITATTSGLSATTSGLYLGDKIIIKENLGGTEYTAQGTVNAINTTTGAITVPSWDTGSTFPASNGYSPNATVFKWQREYFDLTGSLSTHRDAITNLTIRPTNGGGGRTIYLDDFRYNTNYLTASSSSAITSGNNRYLQYRAIFTSTDSFVSPFLTAINTLYTSTANMFAPLIGVSGGGFLSF